MYLFVLLYGQNLKKTTSTREMPMRLLVFTVVYKKWDRGMLGTGITCEKKHRIVLRNIYLLWENTFFLHTFNWCARGVVRWGTACVCVFVWLLYVREYDIGRLALQDNAFCIHYTSLYRLLLLVLLWWANFCELPKCQRTHTRHRGACVHITQHTKDWIPFGNYISILTI